MIRITALVFGVIAVLLGRLWLLQELGIVHLRPILCFADCAPLQSPSVAWGIIGAVTLCVGGICVVWSRKQTPD